MTQTWAVRLDVERRLLSALFLDPVLVPLEPWHFMSPEHGALFAVLQEAYQTWPKPDTTPVEIRETTYDDCEVALVGELIRRDKLLDLFTSVGGVEHYLIGVLIPLNIPGDAIPQLVEQVRECPRCGR